jgi:hypothetical protein
MHPLQLHNDWQGLELPRNYSRQAPRRCGCFRSCIMNSSEMAVDDIHVNEFNDSTIVLASILCNVDGCRSVFCQHRGCKFIGCMVT